MRPSLFSPARNTASTSSFQRMHRKRVRLVSVWGFATILAIHDSKRARIRARSFTHRHLAQGFPRAESLTSQEVFRLPYIGTVYERVLASALAIVFPSIFSLVLRSCIPLRVVLPDTPGDTSQRTDHLPHSTHTETEHVHSYFFYFYNSYL